MIYIHIPFCRTRCIYCGFYSEVQAGLPDNSECPSVQGRLVDALCREMELSTVQTGVSDSSPEAPDTIYIGGGTPSLLALPEFEKLVGTVEKLRLRSGLDSEPEEFTVEVNPDDIVRGGEAYAAGLKRLGVNRVSMGVQSFDDAVLKRMGRRHSSDEAVRAFRILRNAGFDNISIDLMFGFTPQLDTELILKGLALLGSLPEHVSCYQLSVEQGSGLEKMLERGLLALPSDEECEKQYMQLCGILRERGYDHYEISNWALPGRLSRHNRAYWRHRPYLGIGPGAHSLELSGGGCDTVLHRRWNRPDLSAYLMAAPVGKFDSVREGETLTQEQVREERIMLGLRTSEGVDYAFLEESADRSVVEGMISRGLLERVDAQVKEGVPASRAEHRLRIPESRWFISDSIIGRL